MKKKILRGIITFIIIMLALLALSSKKYSETTNVSWTSLPFYTVGINGSYATGNKVTVQNGSNNEWKDVKRVYVKGATSEEDENGIRYAYGRTLSQYNVFCIEEGVHDVYGVYSVGSEYEINDNIMNYILYTSSKNTDKPSKLENGSADSDKPHRTNEQNAFWYYIAKATSNDAKKIKQSSAINTNFSTEGCYNQAEAYAKALEDFNPTMTTILNNNGEIEVTIKNVENYDKYNCKIEVKYTIGNDTTEYTATDCGNNKYKINASGKINIKANVSIDKYKVKCRKLTKKNQQNLLVVTDIAVVKENKSLKKTEYNYTNVSLQKYIVKVNNTKISGRENKKTSANEKATNVKDNISKNNKVEEEDKNYYKYNNAVQIKTGDKVTYRIYVYNNSNVDAKYVQIKDSLPYYTENNKTTSYVEEISVEGPNNQGPKNQWSYEYKLNPTGENTNNKNMIYLSINNFKGNDSIYFDITVKYKAGTRADKIYKNTAWISQTTPKNNTTYRTGDRDYVVMTDYRVSLEKYVSEVNDNSNISFNASKYTNLINYLKNRENKEKIINDMIDKVAKVKNNFFDNYLQYDIDNDGKVTENDITKYNELYQKYNNFNAVTEDNISDYINNDINNDGVVNKIDEAYYKIIQSNLYADNKLDNNDKYAYIIKKLIDSNLLNDETLNYLYVQRLLRNNETVVDNYIKSDVNDDGIVDDSDNYSINKTQNTVTVDGKIFDLNIEKLNELKDISNMKEDFDLFDLNLDGKVNQNDANFYKIYNENKNSFKEITDDYEKFEKENGNDKIYDLNGDEKNDYIDYVIMKQCKKLSETENNSVENFITKYDITTEHKDNTEEVTYEDTEEGIRESSSEVTYEDINTIKVYKGDKQYNSYYNDKLNIYDVNRDGVVDENDNALITECNNENNYSNIKNNNYIQSIIDSNQNDISEFIDLFEKALNGEILFNEIPNDINDEILTIIDENKENTEIGDILEIILSNNITLETIETNKNKTEDYDINEDGKVNQLDIEALEELREYTNNVNWTIADYDLNGDKAIDEGDKAIDEGDKAIDENDKLLFEELSELKNNNEIDAFKKFIDGENSNSYDRKDKAEHNYDNDPNTNNSWKEDNVVTVSNGDKVTYTIKVKNDGASTVKIVKIKDTLPEGVKYESIEGGTYNKNGEITIDKTITSGSSVEVKLTVTVTESNISNNILKNVAEIPDDGLKNNNGVAITDTTLNDNKDADYIQLDYTKPTDENTSFTVEKQWQDNNNSDRPTSIKVQLYKKVNNKESKVGNSITLSSNNWTYTWSDLPKTDTNGNNITYYARELTSNNTVIANNGEKNGDYTVNYIDSYNKTTIINVKEIQLTSYTVQKEWVLNGNDKPDSVRVKLIKINGKEEIDLGKDVITLPKNNNWTYTWNNLPILENGWRYAVRELSEDGTLLPGNGKYNDNIIVTYNDDSSNKITTITNTIETPPPVEDPEVTSYSVTKVWEDNDDSKRPDSIKVRLYKNNGEIVITDANDNKIEDRTLNSSNWTCTWTNLPKKDENGNNITYYAKELKEEKKMFSSNFIPVEEGEAYDENYKVSYKKSFDETIITNIKTTPDTTSFAVEKVWQDNNNSDRPTSIKVQLYKKVNNKESKVGDSITLSSNNWTYTWSNLPKKDTNGNNITYYARELTTNNTVIANNGKNGDYTVNYINAPNKTTIYNSMEETPPPPDEDNDYVIGGIVWNDMALNKTSDTYNGEKDNYENYLSGITVKLYRKDKGIVATTITNENGEYRFTNDDLDKTVLTKKEEQYIKGPKVSGTNRWDGNYYSYYVIFEYDGITYTSTEYIAFGENDDTALKSNAEENYAVRKEFNDKFSTINSESEIEYTTINEEGYIPQSKHIYNSSTMAMKSSTKLIELGNNETIESNLKHVNLGLRGRDIFDLELTTDVFSTKVTVNGVDGTYNYNSNKVTVRRNDLNNYSYREDFANTYAQEGTYKGESYEQKVRTSDIKNSVYENTGLAIQVTYKITVKNASQTAGTATKITNYYDSEYSLQNVYYKDSTDKNVSLGYVDSKPGENDKYGSVVITTPGTELNKSSDPMEIYVVYTLNNPVNLLSQNSILATYNMAEITEYTTSCGEGQTEFTRGLLDKDSAPGSAATEKVRLAPNSIGNVSTVEYYFGGNDLSKLKYEDDTYATPTLYFVKDENNRTINGKVFEDVAKTDKSTKIKTGNGIKDEDEPGVYGATVKLIEQVDGGKVRYTTTTNENGEYTFKGFLPGDYIIKYQYGDKEETMYLNKYSEGINSKSYNGEDFQATNNAYELTVKDENGDEIKSSILDTTENYWYLENEKIGISTATDDNDRRKTVSDNVISFTDEEMTVFNEIRSGATNVTNITNIIENTKMWADTKSMRFELEKGNTTSSNYANYEISNMNFGIAEVPVTTVDLTKTLNKFTITDSTGQNVIASFEAGKTKGNVITAKLNTNGNYWVQVEDEKLQGARLEITYNINLDMSTEINFDNTSQIVPTITGIVDFIDNNLSYNSTLGDNDKYWEVITYTKNNDDRNGLKEELEKMKYTVKEKEITIPQGTVDPGGTKYTTVVKAKDKNPLLLTTTGSETATITLEKVLSSSNSTIEEIITSTVDSFEYSNIVEIIGFNYQNTISDDNEDGDNTTPNEDNFMRDRVRTKDRYIILPGVQHDSATSETLIITPPTGDSSISITYYIIAVISLAVLAVGVFGIKKYVIKK